MLIKGIESDNGITFNQIKENTAELPSLPLGLKPQSG